MDGIYRRAISLTPTTFCSLPWRFSFLSFSFFLFFFFFFSMMTYCITNVWHCNIVPTDSFSITNIWQGETDFKTLIFHQYFTWNLQSRCHISLDLCRGALTFFSALTGYPWRWDWKRYPFQHRSNESIVTFLSFKRDLMKNTILQSSFFC